MYDVHLGLPLGRVLVMDTKINPYSGIPSNTGHRHAHPASLGEHNLRCCQYIDDTETAGLLTCTLNACLR